MKRWVRNVPAVLALTVSACFVLHEGGEQSITFSTSAAPAEVAARALQWFARGGYTVLESRADRIMAEKSRSGPNGDTFDVLTVTMSPEGAGTRVRVHAVTDEVIRGRRRQADQVSGDAIEAANNLSSALMSRE